VARAVEIGHHRGKWKRRLEIDQLGHGPMLAQGI
jgi:hypothetical protein